MNSFFHNISIIFLSLVLCSCQHPLLSGAGSNAGKEAAAEFSAGNYQAARDSYKSLLDKNPNNPDYLIGFADSARMLGENKPAIEAYDKVLKVNSRHPKALEGKGIALMNEGDFAKAARLFARVLEQDALNWRSINAMGVAAAVAGKNEIAMEYYNTALQISRQNPIVLNNLGLSLAMDKKYAASILVFEQAIRALSDENKIKRAEMNLALVYGLSGDMEKSEDLLKKHLTQPQVYNNLGAYAHMAKDNDLAQTYLSKALVASPDFYEKAWANLEAVRPLVSKE